MRPDPISVRCRSLALLASLYYINYNGALSFSWSPRSSSWGRSLQNDLRRSRRCKVPFLTASTLLQTRHSEQSAHSNQGYLVQVFYEGSSCEIYVGQNETILTALERNGVAEQLSMPLPFDCRRGNCLTCSGRLLNSQSSSCVTTNTDIGLTPYMARQVEEAGFVLTCSSYVTGPGVQLELGQNNNAWQQLWSRHFQEEEVQNAGRAAVARVMRFRAEKHLTKWAAETEKILQQPELDPSTTSPLGDWS